ncbi:MAG: 2,3-bisphosphoglycerate-independent phosphoglycerate mutase [Candidatus Anstonellales archaeon]
MALFVILDGVGDIRAEGKGTPLEEAKKPNLDRLVENGAVGLMSTLGRGLTPGSDTGHLAILGYDWKNEYPGRGPLEALGVGMELKEGDVAFRANFATIINGQIVDRRAGRIESEEAERIAKEVEKIKIDGVEILFKHSTEHRGAVVLRGEGLSAKITDTDPHKIRALQKKCEPLEKTKEAKKTAESVNRWTKRVMEILSRNEINKKRKLPANALLLRGAGMHKKVESFEKRFGIKGACIAGGALYKGVARYIGMDVINVKGATGDRNTDLEAKRRAVQSALKKYDFVFLHIKATDSFSHDGNFEGKKQFIEKIDRVMKFDFETDVIVVTGDHTTPWSLKRHSGHEVPIVFSGETVRKDEVKKFDEYSAMRGGIGHIKGKDIVNMIKNYMGKNEIIGS